MCISIAGSLPDDSRHFGAGTILSGAENGPYPARRNPEFVLDRPITPEFASTGYNNFYEFNGTDKKAVKNLVGKFVTRPWTLEVKGLVSKPQTFDIDKLERTMPLEERLYRHRCVEAWSMAVPWTGFPISALIKLVEPKPEARFVRFISVTVPRKCRAFRHSRGIRGRIMKCCEWMKP